MEKKEKLIEQLNTNYRTILSYGKKDLVPMGEFIVKDIEFDTISGEFENIEMTKNTSRIILRKVDDENVEINLPLVEFLSKYIKMAEANSEKTELGANLYKTLSDVQREATQKVLADDSLRNLVEVATLEMDKIDAQYLINGEIQSSNYSICPIDLGKYRERIRERTFDENDDKKKRILKKYAQKVNGKIEVEEEMER